MIINTKLIIIMMIITVTIIMINDIVKRLIIRYKLILRLLKKMTRNDSFGRTLKAGPASQAGRPKRPDNRPDVRPTGCPVQA